MSIMTYREKLAIDMLNAKDRLNRAIEWENKARNLLEYVQGEVKMARLSVDYIKEMSEKEDI